MVETIKAWLMAVVTNEWHQHQEILFSRAPALCASGCASLSVAGETSSSCQRVVYLLTKKKKKKIA